MSKIKFKYRQDEPPNTPPQYLGATLQAAASQPASPASPASVANVTDTGEGVTPGKREKHEQQLSFKPFVRADIKITHQVPLIMLNTDPYKRISEQESELSPLNKQPKNVENRDLFPQVQSIHTDFKPRELSVDIVKERSRIAKNKAETETMLNPVRNKFERNCTLNRDLKVNLTANKFKPLHEEILREEILVSDNDESIASPILKHKLKSPRLKKKKGLASSPKHRRQ